MKINSLFIISLTLDLSLAQAKTPVGEKVSGTVSGFSGLKTDDMVDFALMYPSLSAQDVLMFQVDQLLGPEEDMQVGPQTVKVPGNIFFPKQKENYGFLPITLIKENFSLILEKNKSHEISGLWIKTSFSKLVAFAQKKSSINSVLQNTQVLKGSFFDFSFSKSGQSPQAQLDKELQKQLTFSWTRPTANDNRSDLAILFQRTPAKNWILGDLLSTSNTNGQLRKMSSLDNDFKAVFLSTFLENGRSVQKALGWIRSTSAKQVNIQIQGRPKDIDGISMIDNTRVKWKNPKESGWLSIIVDRNKKTSETAFLDIASFARHLFSPMGIKASEENKWVSPALESLDLDSPLQEGESATLVFIGTSQDVPKPDFLANSEPPLFTYADNIRIYKIK